MYDDEATVELPGALRVFAQFGQLQTRPMTAEQLFYALLVFPMEIHVVSRVNGVLASYRCYQIRLFCFPMKEQENKM